MDVDECALPDTINPNNFPAKLWRLVNNPAYRAIKWDSIGEAILIDKHLFEQEILSPLVSNFDNADAFKTTNFSSFVRQLNLYGFRKVESSNSETKLYSECSGEYFHYLNPIFKKKHPELLASMRRLTADNKAKFKAGEDISCRPPSKHRRISRVDDGRSENMKREGVPLLSPTHQELPHPYYPKKAPPGTVHNRTPVPPRYLIRGCGAALSPSVFASDKGKQMSFNHQHAGAVSGPSAMQVQLGLRADVNHGNVHYPPKYFAPVCSCHPMSQAPQRVCSGFQTGLLPANRYYQTKWYGEHSHDQQNEDNQEMKRCSVNLDRVFQIADEVMQPPPSRCVVEVKTPERPLSESPVTPHTRSTLQGCPLSVGSIITVVRGNADDLEDAPTDLSVVLVPEQLPEDAICVVICDDTETSKRIAVEGSNILKDNNPIKSSSCTETTSDSSLFIGMASDSEESPL
ncbi:heat shock factor protein 5 [Xyrichtys novacula]|uniref:Heat shock factor protein 5 n=1 Tax=Xyrichtys novacula TaxID=13765 RepID=A0AAV1FUR6_XYRNO|nr:heat shock factor protein 5 [Xyrichtys novacula]